MLDPEDEFWNIVERNGGRRPLDPDEITTRIRIVWEDVFVAIAILISLIVIVAKSSGM